MDIFLASVNPTPPDAPYIVWYPACAQNPLGTFIKIIPEKVVLFLAISPLNKVENLLLSKKPSLYI